MYTRLSLPRTLLNCTTSRKDPFSSSWSIFHQYSTTPTLRDIQHTTTYSQCGNPYPIRPCHFSLSSSPVQSTILSFTSPAICSHLQRHSLKRFNAHILSCYPLHQSRHYSRYSASNTSAVRYIIATTIVVLGLSYAAVPLYRMFCQASGYGGTVTKVDPGEKVEKMEPVRERSIVVRFNADTSAGMRWHFKPQQKEITVVPGETALAFYTARNPTDKPVTGISTYNVVPFEAGQYFNKIQCFCFEEQILNPNEEVDMPVFFYIDPEFNDDPAMARVTSLTLSYTFFEAKEGDSIYLPVQTTHHTH